MRGCEVCKCIGIGILIGICLGIGVAGAMFGGTLDATEQLRRRAIKAKVGEYYLNDYNKLEFRFLTEHKE